MLDQILNQIVPILVTVIVGVLVVVIKSVGDAATSYIQAKKDAIVLKIGVDKYNQQLAFAGSIWDIVEENFRIGGMVWDIILQKQEMFDKLLKEKVPSLTNEQKESLRQSIAGVVNSGRDIIVTPAIKTIPQEPSEAIQPLLPQEDINTTVEVSPSVIAPNVEFGIIPNPDILPE